MTPYKICTNCHWQLLEDAEPNNLCENCSIDATVALPRVICDGCQTEISRTEPLLTWTKPGKSPAVVYLSNTVYFHKECYTERIKKSRVRFICSILIFLVLSLGIICLFAFLLTPIF
ncbi:hypothetical protein SCLARK_00737 [Spiroplasma clarkii]|uniref:Uncharacterized protein n=1 Tax=Spiroplasma clarkii TaxID=2139 RepID=A0A1Y0L040_9MOLU|nr:hypothetical protein [Spiroplasma clarkii]ARU91384.1 hypothetical protein SCLARK_00737 [Spiroplasma clarkii]ATX70800.1 hypothetical protein SCLAR_v1c04790 [Spiroplasma clarkii]